MEPQTRPLGFIGEIVMYDQYKMETINFGTDEVFAAIGDEASDNGSGSYSLKPDRSDS